MKEKGYFNLLATLSVPFRLKSGKICKNMDHTHLFHCIYTCRVPLTMNTWPDGFLFKQLPQDLANINA